MTIRSFTTWIAAGGLAALVLTTGASAAHEALSARRPLPLPLLDTARRPMPLPLLDTARRPMPLPLLDARVVACPRNLPLLDGDFQRAQVAGQTAMATVAAAAAHADGSGVTVAVIDGGWDTGHEYLEGHLVGGYDAIDHDLDAGDLGNDVDDDGSGTADDAVGHGTFVAGQIIAAAPGVRIMPIRALDDEGNGTPHHIAVAIEHATQNGADVICLSAVVPTMPLELQLAIAQAVQADVAIVTAAGNDAAGPTDHGFLVENATVVGAVDSGDATVCWSPSSGDVHVYGPGGDRVGGPIGGDVPDSYGWWEGTSFAAAYVAAAAAMKKELAPSISAADMKAHLMGAVDPVTGCTPATRGRINLETATE